jgi:hypothetical protein
MDIGVVLLSYFYLKYTKYVIVCYLLCFCVYTLFSFYIYVPHWYVRLYAVGLVERVSLSVIIMGVLCVCFCFYIFYFENKIVYIQRWPRLYPSGPL